MAKRSTRRKQSNSRPPQQQKKKTAKQVAMPKAAEVVGFTELEEEFFRAGAAIEQGEAEHEDNVYAAPSFWRRLFAREQHAS